MSFIAADNETGERRGRTCEFPPLVPFLSLPPYIFAKQRDKKSLHIGKREKPETERKHDRWCVGGRNSETELH